MVNEFMQKNRARVVIVPEIEAVVDKNTFFRRVEGLDPTRAFAETVLQLLRGDLMNFRVGLGHGVTADIMNRQEELSHQDC